MFGFNLGGMFAGLNNSIMNAEQMIAPDDQSVPGMLSRGPQDKMNPMLRAVMQAGGSALGKDMRTSQEVAQATARDVGEKTFKTSKDYFDAAQMYGKAGMTQQQMAMVQQGQAMAAQEAELARAQRAREATAERAASLGFDDLATSLRDGSGDVNQIAKDLTEYERDEILLKRDKPARILVLKQAGYSSREAEILAENADTARAAVNDKEMKLSGFSDAEGNPVLARVGKFGRVFDPETGTMRNASEMGLKPEIKTTRTLDSANTLGGALAKEGAASFAERYQLARDATKTLELNNVSEELLGEEGDRVIYTGVLGSAKTWLEKAAYELGMKGDQKNAEATEAFLVQRASEVAQVIKAFGAGTGLSDADREYAAKIAAGSQDLTEGAIRFLIASSTIAAKNIRKDYNNTYEKVMAAGKKTGKIDEMTAEMFRLPEVRSITPEESPLLKKEEQGKVVDFNSFGT